MLFTEIDALVPPQAGSNCIPSSADRYAGDECHSTPPAANLYTGEFTLSATTGSLSAQRGSNISTTQSGAPGLSSCAHAYCRTSQAGDLPSRTCTHSVCHRSATNRGLCGSIQAACSSWFRQPHPAPACLPTRRPTASTEENRAECSFLIALQCAPSALSPWPVGKTDGSACLSSTGSNMHFSKYWKLESLARNSRKWDSSSRISSSKAGPGQRCKVWSSTAGALWNKRRSLQANCACGLV